MAANICKSRLKCSECAYGKRNAEDGFLECTAEPDENMIVHAKPKVRRKKPICVKLTEAEAKDAVAYLKTLVPMLNSIGKEDVGRLLDSIEKQLGKARRKDKKCQ